jgi:hypothetical protein
MPQPTDGPATPALRFKRQGIGAYEDASMLDTRLMLPEREGPTPSGEGPTVLNTQLW